MPKILRIINRFNLGGITYNVSYLTKYLPSEYETLLIGGPEEEGESSSLHITDSLGLKPLILKELNRNINPIKDYRSYKEIKKIIQEFKPDIVHTHASKAGAIGRLAAISCKVPIIIHTFHGHVFHSYFGKLKTYFYKSIERYLAKKSTAIIAISAIQKQELVEKFKISSADQTYIIPLGFDLERFNQNVIEKRQKFRQTYKIKQDEIAIAIIGRLAPIKNHELFIDAITYTATKTSKKIKAFIVGDGETKQQLINYIKSKNYEYSFNTEKETLFNFIGWQKEIDMVLNGIDIIALSSKNEGTPVSLIEAQAAGKFMVTTNVGGIKDILKPGCGFITKTDKEFCEKLLESVSNHNELMIQAQKGIVFAQDRFSYKRLVKDIDELYKTLMKKQP
jgi:glycosyltransferase involved in cell wall biosynthesis